jgi:hypothetical protein
MKSIFSIFLIAFFNSCIAQNITELKESYESLKTNDETESYFAFAKGDTILVYLEVTDGELSELKIYEYQGGTKFSAKDFNSKIEKRIVVTKTECYGFKFKSKEGCKFNYTINRIAGKNTPPEYSTKVDWLEGEENETVSFVNITENPEFISLCSSSGKLNPLSGCNEDRVTRSYLLPQNTIYWIYEFDVDNSQIDKEVEEHSALFNQINESNISSDAKLAGNILMFLSKPPRTGYACDLLLLPSTLDAKEFSAHNDNNWKFFPDISKMNTQSVAEKLDSFSEDNRIYFGFRNNQNFDELRVKIQVTAAVIKKEKKQKPVFQSFD